MKKRYGLIELQRENDMPLIDITINQKMPMADKRKLLLTLAKKYDVKLFVETGSYQGDTIRELYKSGQFEALHSIELHKENYDYCTNRNGATPNVFFYFGDSATDLKPIVKQLKKRTLFFLDAHYSGAGTTVGSIKVPALAELEQIKESYIKTHVIVIDNINSFAAGGDYPSVDELVQAIQKINKNYNIMAMNDILYAWVSDGETVHNTLEP